MQSRQQGDIRATLLNTPITGAVTGIVSAIVKGLVGINSLAMQANFTYGSGGTNATVWVQTSLDSGVTWIDIASFQFLLASLRKLSVVTMFPSTAFAANTTATDGTLTANTVLNGLIGDQLRTKLTTTGTYAGGTSLAVDIVGKV